VVVVEVVVVEVVVVAGHSSSADEVEVVEVVEVEVIVDVLSVVDSSPGRHWLYHSLEKVQRQPEMHVVWPDQ
jgi:hypothetical protein